MFSRCFGDVHMWGQIWPHKVWTSLCQVLFFSNLLHSQGVWHFDIWQIISKSNMSCHTRPLTPHHSPQPPSPNPTPNEPACVILTLLDILHFHVFFDKIWPNNRSANPFGLGAPVFEILDPPLVYCITFSSFSCPSTQCKICYQWITCQEWHSNTQCVHYYQYEHTPV